MTVNAIVTRGYGPAASVGIPRIVRRGYHSYLGFLDVPAAGRQFVIAAAGPYDPYSVFDDTNSAAGNIADVALIFSPSGADLSMGSDGIPFTDDPTTGRQQFDWREFDITDLAYIPVTGAVDGITATYYLGNVAPIELALIPAQFAWTNVQHEGVILDDYVGDAEGDALTFNVTLPTGLIVETVVLFPGEPNERTVQRIRGIPTTGQQGSYSPVIEAVDIAGDSVFLTAFSLLVGVGVQVPVVDDTTKHLEVAKADLAAVGLITLVIIAEINGATPGNVFDQTPAGGSYVIPGASIELRVSGYARPNVVGLSQAAALAAITAALLVPSLEDGQFSDSVAFGDVISQDPAPTGIGIPGEVMSIVVSLGPLAVIATVRAYAPGYFPGEGQDYKQIGDTFTLTAPEQYSPYWMEFVGGAPASWVGLLQPFVQSIDQEMLEFGRPVPP